MNILAMGGYGAYVWPAYAVTLVIFAINIISSWRETKRIKKLLRQQLNSHES